MDSEGESSTSAGRICGMIGTILNIVSVLGCVFWIMLQAMLEAQRNAF
jgi:hypothetical protein